MCLRASCTITSLEKTIKYFIILVIMCMNRFGVISYHSTTHFVVCPICFHLTFYRTKCSICKRDQSSFCTCCSWRCHRVRDLSGTLSDLTYADLHLPVIASDHRENSSFFQIYLQPNHRTSPCKLDICGYSVFLFSAVMYLTSLTVSKADVSEWVSCPI